MIIEYTRLFGTYFRIKLEVGIFFKHKQAKIKEWSKYLINPQILKRLLEILTVNLQQVLYPGPQADFLEDSEEGLAEEIVEPVEEVGAD